MKIQLVIGCIKAFSNTFRMPTGEAIEHLRVFRNGEPDESGKRLNNLLKKYNAI